MKVSSATQTEEPQEQIAIGQEEVEEGEQRQRVVIDADSGGSSVKPINTAIQQLDTFAINET